MTQPFCQVMTGIDVLYYFREQIVLSDDGETKSRLWQTEKMLEQSMTLMNNLGFNLCVAPWSLVVMLVAYFGVEESHQNKGPKKVEQELEWTGRILGPDDINLQTEKIHCNYSVLIGSPEQEESSLLHYSTIYNFRRIIRRIKLHNCQISGI